METILDYCDNVIGIQLPEKLIKVPCFRCEHCWTFRDLVTHGNRKIYDRERRFRLKNRSKVDEN